MALEPTAPSQEALASWRDSAVAGRDDLRPVARDALHVTLAFLGYRPEKEIPEIATVVREATAGLDAPVLAPAGVKALPPRGPRLFALDLHDEEGRAVTLQAALSAALEAGRFYRPEKRPFWPHITLARVKRERRAAPLEPAEPAPDSLELAAVTLYRSILRPQGALYEPLERVSLAN